MSQIIPDRGFVHMALKGHLIIPDWCYLNWYSVSCDNGARLPRPLDSWLWLPHLSSFDGYSGKEIFQERWWLFQWTIIPKVNLSLWSLSIGIDVGGVLTRSGYDKRTLRLFAGLSHHELGRAFRPRTELSPPVFAPPKQPLVWGCPYWWPLISWTFGLP